MDLWRSCSSIFIGSSVLGDLNRFNLMYICFLTNPNWVIWQLFYVKSCESEFSVFPLAKGKHFLELVEGSFIVLITTPYPIIYMCTQNAIKNFRVILVPKEKKAIVQGVCFESHFFELTAKFLVEKKWSVYASICIPIQPQNFRFIHLEKLFQFWYGFHG